MIEQLEQRVLFTAGLHSKHHHFLASQPLVQNLDVPQAPTNVSAITNYVSTAFVPFVGTGQMGLSATISWNYLNADQYSFNIYRSTTDKNLGSFTEIGTVNGLTSFVDNNISEHTNYFYYYEITAVSNGVESTNSTPIILGLLNVSQTVVGQTVHLLWQSSSVALYYIYRSDNNGPYQWLANTYNNSYTDSVTGGKSYIYKIFGANQYIGYSPSLLIPYPNLTYSTYYAPDNSYVVLNWQDPPNISGIEIDRSSDGGNTWIKEVILPPIASGFEDTAVQDQYRLIPEMGGPIISVPIWF